jgi:multicomponent Na+:H+ antiporter subunit E
MPEQGTSHANSPGGTTPALDSPRRAALLRGLAFFGLWLVLIQSVKVADLAFGACAAVTATWVSLRLSPPAAGCVRFTSLLLLLPHFLWQSVRAGVDVARRAFAWRVDVHPGLVTYTPGFPPGQARNTFATITSLLPGTVPCDETVGELVYHCLDTRQLVVEQLREEERRFARALVAGRGYD